MIHPHTELRFVGEAIGYGVFATRDIPCGTITWTGDALDRSFSSEEIAALAPPYREILRKYSYVTRGGSHLLCWDFGRYINHSCEPSCLGAGYDFEIAVRDIAAGEELTDDYGMLNVELDFECRCGAPRCRRSVGPGDVLLYAEAWDRVVAEPFRLIPTVEQPLWGFVEERAEMERVLASGEPPASSRRHYFPGLSLPEAARGA